MWPRVLFVIGAVLVLGTGYAGPPLLPRYRSDAALAIAPLPTPGVRRNGRLSWLGGARLTSDDPAFGGFSALAVAGDRFVLLDDGGNVLRFALGPGWRPGAVRFDALPAGPRAGWEKRDRDSESLAADPDGRLWVGFERANQIWRYAPGFGRAEGFARPSAMRRWSSNGGAEAMVRLADGRFVVFSEGSLWRRRPGRAAIVFAGDPVAAPERGFRFTYLPAPGFAVADATQLPDGDLLVLERGWRLPLRFRSRLARVPVAALRPGARVRGREVGRIAPPWPTENYEGIVATRAGRATVLWLVSDNDQAVWRSTYLLKLRLD